MTIACGGRLLLLQAVFFNISIHFCFVFLNLFGFRKIKVIFRKTIFLCLRYLLLGFLAVFRFLLFFFLLGDKEQKHVESSKFFCHKNTWHLFNIRPKHMIGYSIQSSEETQNNI